MRRRCLVSAILTASILSGCDLLLSNGSDSVICEKSALVIDLQGVVIIPGYPPKQPVWSEDLTYAVIKDGVTVTSGRVIEKRGTVPTVSAVDPAQDSEGDIDTALEYADPMFVLVRKDQKFPSMLQMLRFTIDKYAVMPPDGARTYQLQILSGATSVGSSEFSVAAGECGEYSFTGNTLISLQPAPDWILFPPMRVRLERPYDTEAVPGDSGEPSIDPVTGNIRVGYEAKPERQIKAADIVYGKLRTMQTEGAPNQSDFWIEAEDGKELFKKASIEDNAGTEWFEYAKQVGIEILGCTKVIYPPEQFEQLCMLTKVGPASQ